MGIREARTPAREIPEVPSCAATSFPELCLGDTGVLRLDTPVCTHRPLTSYLGSTPTNLWTIYFPLYSTVLYCTVLYCTVLCCIVCRQSTLNSPPVPLLRYYSHNPTGIPQPHQ